MSRIVAGQQAKLTAQTCFSELRKHLTRATVTHCYAFKKEEQDEEEEAEQTKMNSADPYKSFIFEEVDFNEDESASQEGMR